MKNPLLRILNGKDTKLSGLIALGFVAAVALGCTCGKNFDLGNLGKESNSSRTSSNSSNDTTTSSSDDGDIPPQSELQSMLKETAADFATAINTEDFHQFYTNASTDFQTTYTEEQAKNAFKIYIDKKKTVLPSLNKIQTTDAQFTVPPRIRTENGLSILVLEGKFPTKPLEVKFDAEYVQRGGEWKLLVWKLNLG